MATPSKAKKVLFTALAGLGVTVGAAVTAGALVGCTVAVGFGDAPASA